MLLAIADGSKYRGVASFSGKEFYTLYGLVPGRWLAKFDGAGCAISTASASLMTEALKGKPVSEAEDLFREVHTLLTAEKQAGKPTEFLGKLTVLTGVKEYPMRVKCATLAWHTMRAALAEDTHTVTTE